MTLENKTILITGASAGIGKAIAGKLSLINCRLILAARRISLLDEIKSNPAAKAEIETVQCDVSKKEDVAAAYKFAVEKFGNIDIAILNAGVGMHVTPTAFNSEYAEKVMGTNFMGVVYWIEHLLKDYLKNNRGTIVGISSLADNRAYGTSFYNPSKAALTIFLEGLRLDLKKHNINVITVRPGFVETDMTSRNNFKMPFLISPSKAAEIIVEGIIKEKKMIQFPIPTVLLTRIIGFLPLSLYELFAAKGKK